MDKLSEKNIKMEKTIVYSFFNIIGILLLSFATGCGQAEESCSEDICDNAITLEDTGTVADDASVDTGSLRDGSSILEDASIEDASVEDVSIEDASTDLGVLPDDSSVIPEDELPTISIVQKPQAIVSERRPTFVFSSGGATTVECRLAGEVVVTCNSPFRPNAPLVDGLHTFEVIARNEQGQMASQSYSFTVDTLGPNISITGFPIVINTNNTPTVIFSTSEDTTQVTCLIDAATVSTECSSPFMIPALSDGEHTMTILAIDALGNQSEVIQSFLVDTQGPELRQLQKINDRVCLLSAARFDLSFI